MTLNHQLHRQIHYHLDSHRNLQFQIGARLGPELLLQAPVPFLLVFESRLLVFRLCCSAESLVKNVLVKIIFIGTFQLGLFS
jgi:hypothetical protein